ncbi:MAG: MscL family protein [Mycoplasmatales bacterium]
MENKSFLKRFQEFLLASSFVDVAIGLLVAAALKDLVTSFTSSFVTPIVMRIFSLVGISSDTTAVTTIFGINFTIIAFITALISFVIILFVAFSILEAYTAFKKKIMKESPEDIPVSKQELLLEEIRDLLKENSKPKKVTKKKTSTKKK